MGLKEWIVPQEKKFFDLLESESRNVLVGAKALEDLIKNFHGVREKIDRIKEIEHEGDNVVHQIYQRLNRTFVTPIDHEDISKLASLYDDVLDFIDAVANRLFLYEIRQPTSTMIHLAEIIVKLVEEIDFALASIRKIDQKEMEARCAEINRLENEADQVLNTSVASLFKTKDPIEIIKLKEIYEFMEIATDKCEDVSDTLRDIVIKNA